MKSLLLVNVFLLAINVFSQVSESDCYKYMNTEGNSYFTDTTYLSNGSILYYKWNCDSTWLTFEGKNKRIIKSCSDEDPILCSRTGLSFIKEYPNYLLFAHYWISGCCTPPDVVFIDKKTGEEKKRIENSLFVTGDADKDYLLYFSDTTYTSLVYLNHSTNKKSYYRFDKGEVLESMRKNAILQLSDIFYKFKKEKGYFAFEFKNQQGNIKEHKITLN